MSLKYGIYNQTFLYGMVPKAASEVLSILYTYHMHEHLQKDNTDLFW